MNETATDKLHDKCRNITPVLFSYARKIQKGVLELEQALCEFPAPAGNKTHIVLHHSLTIDSRTVSWPAIRKYHVHTLGWRDIGYHAGIEEIRNPGEYEVLIGRDYFDTGAHCTQNNMNKKGFGFCFVGNFDETDPPEPMLERAAEYLATVCRLGNISPENITGHRDHNPGKSCPGKRFDIDDFRNRVLELL